MVASRDKMVAIFFKKWSMFGAIFLSMRGRGEILMSRDGVTGDSNVISYKISDYIDIILKMLLNLNGRIS